jgi:hypothetical protein
MDINIEPKKIYKIIRDSGKPRKDEIIRCVEMMAWEAEELCNTWEKLIKLSIKKGKITKKDKEKLLKSNLFGENAPLYGRLLHFYRNISTALGNKKSYDWIEIIYNRVAKVILYQSDINKSLDEFNKTKLSEFPLYLSSKNNGSEIKDFKSSLRVLQNEVSILKSLPEILKLVKIDK